MFRYIGGLKIMMGQRFSFNITVNFHANWITLPNASSMLLDCSIYTTQPLADVLIRPIKSFEFLCIVKAF